MLISVKKKVKNVKNMHAVKKVYKQVQKTFCEKMGKSRVGRACALK